MLKIKNAVISVSDKTNLEPLAKALHQHGTTLFASSGTKTYLSKLGIPCKSVEEITKTPEAFQGRMKTLSFPLLSGILSKRGDESDLSDLKKLSILEIDAVVVNFYPFEDARLDSSEAELTELIDIGGPTMVRAAAKNCDSVLVLTQPQSYRAVIDELKIKNSISKETLKAQAHLAWERVLQYDQAIAERITGSSKILRYGENPHQKSKLIVNQDSPIDWNNPLGEQELSYNNVLDISSAFYLGRELKQFLPNHASVVIVKHNNPCGVASVPIGNDLAQAQLSAMELAWAGDPVSAFGGVILFTDPICENALTFFKQKFVDVMVAPRSSQQDYFAPMFSQKKKMKGAWINHWDVFTKKETWKTTSIPGGKIVQTLDEGLDPDLKPQTKFSWNDDQVKLARFGTLVTRSLKSNAIGVVYAPKHDTFQLVGAGQGQPNRIDALAKLAVPRAINVLTAAGLNQQEIGRCILISDAFFPFQDSVEVAGELGIKWIVQPGGSIRDQEVIAKADALNIGLAFTGRRHFNH